MNKLKQMPIWRDANRFLLSIEKVVKLFPRYHKYTLGTELRNNALKICNLIHQAWQKKNQQCVFLLHLKYCIDEIKIQLGNKTQVFIPTTSAITQTLIIKQKGFNQRGIRHREVTQIINFNQGNNYE